MTNDISNQQLLDALTQQLGTISDNMVVREDVEEIVGEVVGEIVEDKIGRAVKNLATKDELRDAIENLATKEELDSAVKNLATKDELKNATKDLATKAELNSAVLRLERNLDGYQKANTGHHLETRSEIGKLNKELGKMREGLTLAAGLA